MTFIGERLRQFTERETRTPQALDSLTRAIGHARLPGLTDSAYIFNAHADRLQANEREQLLGAFYSRVESVVRTRMAGLASVPRAHRQPCVRMLKRETLGLFAAAFPDTTALSQHADMLVARAQASALARRSGAFSHAAFSTAAFAHVAERVLGLNSGPDEISEAHLLADAVGVRLEAYDRVGFHVLSGLLIARPHALYISELKAAHGRNIEELGGFGAGHAHLPGRGNARAVSEALTALMESAVAAGFTSLACTPGSPEVARLYAKMGFVDIQHESEMVLDLTDAQAVKHLLFVFTASRAGISDVPKNVAARIRASGRAALPPNRTLERLRGDDHLQWRLAPHP